MRDRFWGLGEKTPYRKSVQQGDQVVFYLASPVKSFAGTAVLSSPSFALTPEQQEDWAHGSEFYRAAYGVRLDEVNIWELRKQAESVITELDFIENKEFWGQYLQGGIRQLQERDFRRIALGQQSDSISFSSFRTNIENPSQFALEAHLEEFLDKNWAILDFGAPLVRYSMEEESGRQFPAGPWSIDFLCTDRETREFVVIELKRGKTSDATVGQILRYMAWVKENLAKPSQGVRGIIIARETDEALAYAVKLLPSVSLLTYQVDFKLVSGKK
jgi:hypothetical protein